MLTKSGTLFYNWAKIEEHCDYTIVKIRDFFVKYAKQPNPKFDGYSFLLNPGILYTKEYTATEIVEYIALAGRRNYFDVEYFNDPGLSLIYVPTPVQRLKKNRLLEIEGNKLYFKFEKV